MPLPARQGLNRPTQPRLQCVASETPAKSEYARTSRCLISQKFYFGSFTTLLSKHSKSLTFTTGMEVRFQLPPIEVVYYYLSLLQNVSFCLLSKVCFMVGACMHAKLGFSCIWFFATSSPPGSSIYGILQTRILEWVAMPFSRGSSWPRNLTCVSYISCIGRRVLLSLVPYGKPVLWLDAIAVHPPMK